MNIENVYYLSGMELTLKQKQIKDRNDYIKEKFHLLSESESVTQFVASTAKKFNVTHPVIWNALKKLRS